MECLETVQTGVLWCEGRALIGKLCAQTMHVCVQKQKQSRFGAQHAKENWCSFIKVVKLNFSTLHNDPKQWGSDWAVV